MSLEHTIAHDLLSIGAVFLRAGLSPSQNREAYDLHRPSRRRTLESDFFLFERRK